MIKELITATMLATSIGIQNTTTNTTNVNNFQGFEEIQQQNDYYEGEIERARRLTTIAYSNLWIGTGINVKARAMQYYDRNIADNEYITRQILILKLNTLIQVDEWTLSVKNQPQYNQFLQSGIYTVSYITGQNQAIDSFYNGQNYYTFDAMLSFFNQVRTDSTFLANIQALGNLIKYRNTNNIGDYIILETTYNWTNVTDQGLFLNDILPYTDVQSNIVWTVPAQTGEIVDIPGMMFEILGMPFAWLSLAFNFTIFPGTPYAVNISNILMAIVVGLIAIFIVKKFIK